MTTPPPHFYVNPPFQVYSPFLAKNFCNPPSDSIFGRSYSPPPLIREGRGGSNYVWTKSLQRNSFFSLPYEVYSVFTIFVIVLKTALLKCLKSVSSGDSMFIHLAYNEDKIIFFSLCIYFNLHIYIIYIYINIYIYIYMI